MQKQPEANETYLGQPRLPYLNPQENPNGQVKPQGGGRPGQSDTPQRGKGATIRGRGQRPRPQKAAPKERLTRLPPSGPALWGDSSREVCPLPTLLTRGHTRQPFGQPKLHEGLSHARSPSQDTTFRRGSRERGHHGWHSGPWPSHGTADPDHPSGPQDSPTSWRSGRGHHGWTTRSPASMLTSRPRPPVRPTDPAQHSDYRRGSRERGHHG